MTRELQPPHETDGGPKQRTVISQAELSTDPEAGKVMLENIRDFGHRNKIGVDYVA